MELKKLETALSSLNLETLYVEQKEEFFEAMQVIDKFDSTFSRDYRREYKSISKEYEYDDLTELDGDDYGEDEYDYDTKSEAKKACSEYIDEAISDITDELEDIISDVNDHYDDMLSTVDEVLNDYINDITSDFEDLFDVLQDCGDKTALSDLCKQIENEYKLLLVTEAFNIRFQETRKKIEKLGKSSGTYLKLCDYDEDDDCWCFYIQDGLDQLYEDAEKILEDYCSSFDDLDFETEVEDILDKAREMTEDISELIKEKTYYDDMKQETGIFARFMQSMQTITQGAKLIFKDAAYEGKKEGYCIAAEKYEGSFNSIKKDYTKLRKMLIKLKDERSATADQMLSTLEDMETHKSALAQKDIDELGRRRDELTKKLDLKVNSMSDEYSLQPEELRELIRATEGDKHSVSGASVLANGIGPAGVINVVSGIGLLTFNVIVKIKNKNYNEGLQEGYEEAGEMYEEKISIMRNKINDLVEQAEEKLKKYATVLAAIFDEIIACNVRLATLEIAEEAINDDI